MRGVTRRELTKKALGWYMNGQSDHLYVKAMIGFTGLDWVCD